MTFIKTTSPRTQSSLRLKIRYHSSTNNYQDFQPQKIASGMQQRLAELMARTLSTEPRNDEGWCEGRKLRPSHIEMRDDLCSQSMRHISLWVCIGFDKGDLW